MPDPATPDPDDVQVPVLGTMTVHEVTGLVHLFNTQLSHTENRLVAKMDDNSRIASERWVRHDQELEKNTRRVVERFEKVESAILVLETSLKAHLDKEHDEDVAMDARLRPVRFTVTWLFTNWRTVLLLLFGLLGWFAISADLLARYVGGAS